ncbi:hypothetical protein CGH46_20570, partial [Vibrio parahaemolyticus]
ANEVEEYLSDTHRLAKKEVQQVIFDSESYGFVDVEKLQSNEKIYFNGNLFRKDSAEKVKKVLDSLKPDEERLVKELTSMIQSKGCVDVTTAKNIVGDKLFEKIHSIGLFDFNVVCNNAEEVGFLTLPAAFSKYSNSMLEDAFDLAKAFVASLTYGITKSYYERGQISDIGALLRTLINGQAIGPVNAIGQDYKVLEIKGVVKIYQGSKKGRTGHMMKLLKREVGELALLVLKSGDASQESLMSLPGATVTKYIGPETNREITRRQQVKQSPFATNDMISALRTGGIK